MWLVVSSSNSVRELIKSRPIYIIRFVTIPRELQIDPRFSITALASIGATGLLVLSSSPGMGVLLAYLLTVHVFIGGGVNLLLRHASRAIPVFVLIVLLNGVFVSGVPLVTAGDRTLLTKDGVYSGVFYSLRFLVLYWTALVFLDVTPPVEFARGVYTILRPISSRFANAAAFYGFISLSFLPLFADEFERIRIAQSFRGGGLEGGLVRRVSSVRLLVVPLVMSAIRRSEQVAAVVELRGLRDRLGLGHVSTRPTLKDVAFSLFTLAAILVSVLVVD